MNSGYLYPSVRWWTSGCHDPDGLYFQRRWHALREPCPAPRGRTATYAGREVAIRRRQQSFVGRLDKEYWPIPFIVLNGLKDHEDQVVLQHARDFIEKN